MADSVDRAADKFAKAWEKVKNKSVGLYRTIANSGESNTVKVVQIANLDLSQLFLDDPELKKAITALAVEHINVLKGMTAFAQVDDAYITALIKIDEAVYIGATGPSGAEIKALMGESITANLPEADFAKALQQTGLRDYQANALANDSLRKYERSVNKVMADNSPASKLYEVIGPLDSRTRQLCVAALAAGAMTLAQWDAQFPGYFVVGSGIGCRHTVVPTGERA